MTARVPPQSKECEQGVIGAILLEPDLFEQVLDVIPNQDFFYLKEHQTIFKAAFNLFTKGKRIDLLTVTDELRANNELESVGGAYGLTQIANTIVTTAHVITHARTVAEKYVLREIIKLGNDAIAKAYEGEDCFELKEQVISNLSSLYEQNSYTVEHISNPIKRSLEDMFKASQSNSFTLGYPSGLRTLDELTNGFQDKQLIVIAARPGCFDGEQLIHTKRGVVKIKDITTNDHVLSYNVEKDYNEWKPVIATPIHEKTNDRMFKIKLKDGTVIKVTENHEFFTDSGFLKIKDILLPLTNGKDLESNTRI